MRRWPEALGGYRVLGTLGSGGMGTVLRAQDPASGAQRALKVLAPSASAESRLRFRREGEALAAVSAHPHVARVHAAGEEEGWAWVALELLPGGDLRQRLEAGPLPAAEVLRLGQALASGLEHVHRAGVLHRDLKPGNVMFDEEGRPKLVDFGLAGGESYERLTATGTVMGTPAYMAPEQVRGAATDPRTDVYGLGALLYHALTGRAPFQGGGAVQILAQVLGEPPPSPSELVAGVPAELEAALLRALAKDPAARFASARELGAALGRDPRPPAGRGAGRFVAVAVALGLASVAALAALRTPSGGAGLAGGLTPPSAGTARSPSTLPEAELAAALEAEDPVAGLALLERCWGAAPHPAALGWAAGFLLLGVEPEQARRWQERCAGESGPEAAWVRTAAGQLLAPQDASLPAAHWALRDVLEAERVLGQTTPPDAGASRKSQEAFLATWVEQLERLLRAAREPGPTGRALAIRAARLVWARHSAVLSGLGAAGRAFGGSARSLLGPWEELLARAGGLLPVSSRSGGRLRLLRACVGLWSDDARLLLRDEETARCLQREAGGPWGWVVHLPELALLVAPAAQLRGLAPERAEAAWVGVRALSEALGLPLEWVGDLDDLGPYRMLHNRVERAAGGRVCAAYLRCWEQRESPQLEARFATLRRAIEEQQPLMRQDADRLLLERARVGLALMEARSAEAELFLAGMQADGSIDRYLLEVEAALCAGDLDRARVRLRPLEDQLAAASAGGAVRDLEDQRHLVRAARARVLARTGQPERAREVLEGVPPGWECPPAWLLPWLWEAPTREFLAAVEAGQRPQRPWPRAATPSSEGEAGR